MKKTCFMVVMVFAGAIGFAGDFRIGIIGCDTSHAIAFAKLANVEKNPQVAGFRVVAAHKWGSADIFSSTNRYPKYIAQLQGFGVEMKDSIADLIASVDGVLLETNDGRPHYRQALEVFRSGKPCFIDKPVAADLADVIRIVEAGRKYNAKWFCTSTLRFTGNAQEVRRGDFGKVRGAFCWSPTQLEPTQSRYFWYAVHAAEPLFTVMGTGCEYVQATGNATEEGLMGVWKDGRIGQMRAFNYAKPGFGYGGIVFPEEKGAKPVMLDGKSAYDPLLAAITRFFKTGETPVTPEETLELYAFLAAGEKSFQENGRRVTLDEVLSAARVEAKRRTAQDGLD